MISHLTEEFASCFHKLPSRVQRLARKSYRLWKQNPSRPGLYFKRVGKNKLVYSVRVGIDWRALGLKVDDAIVWFWIGSHAEFEYSAEQIRELRSRHEYEDGLLNDRTNIVLVFNGLMAAAASLGIQSRAAIALAAVTLAINVLWIPCSFQHGSYMTLLSKTIRKSPHKPLSEKLRHEHQKRRIITPTLFMSKVLPVLLTIGWLVWIALKITNTEQ